MLEAYNRKVPKYLFGAFCIYLLYYAFIIMYLRVDSRWFIVPGVSLAAIVMILRFRRESIAVHAYTITIFTFINIMGYSVMLHEFTEVFTVFCAAVCLISFYHMLQVNYLMLGFSTVFVLYWFIWQDEWQAFLYRDSSIAITIRVFSLYLVQVLLIILIKKQKEMQRLVEQKIQEAETAGQAKEDFLANMSHEIRTPMNAITGMVELALRNEHLPEQEREYLYNIQSAGENLLSIIDDILDVTKIDSGNLEITEEPYEITSIVHDVMNVIQVMLGEKEVELLVDIDPNIPARLKGDGVRIKQIMMNLMGNAVKYTEQGKIHLKLETGPAEGQDGKINLKVSVADTGIGISQEQMNDLFTVFKQANSRRNRSAGGSGLGLAISKKLIELMHGTLHAESELGKGSTFTFTIVQEVIDAKPCIDVDSQVTLQSTMKREAVKKEKERRKKAGRQITFTAPDAKILIVDDNKVNLKVAEGLLRPYHMNVETADSGSRAIEMVQNEHFDLVFMDHMMPVMDGVDATKIIRELQGEYFQKVAIVALSANAVRGAREMFLEAGMNDFVAKPIEMRSMDRTLRRWLPEEKIISNKNAEEAVNREDDSMKMNPCLWQMEGIDVAAAMEYACGDAELYREVLSDYRDSIYEKADVIERAVTDKDLDMYTIEVHSLKSTSKSIGAMELSKLAQELEECGKSGNWEIIIDRTPELLRGYRELYNIIAPYCRVKEQPITEKKPFDKEELLNLLGQLSDSMDEYDSMGGEETVKALSEYAYQAPWDSYMEQISRAIGRFDYDICKEVALKWQRELAENPDETEGN
ncbi:MAG: response regulator [Lachnospiraceae bacterium]|nr:response regulator [Lachnospiraceae bacterium]